MAPSECTGSFGGQKAFYSQGRLKSPDSHVQDFKLKAQQKAGASY
jgi:hypothetical protein